MWHEYDEQIVSEWERRKAAYKTASKPVWLALYGSVAVLALALVLPFSSAAAKLFCWLLFFGVLFSIDFGRMHQYLRCPNCNRVPFLSGFSLASSTSPKRCVHCAKLLRRN